MVKNRFHSSKETYFCLINLNFNELKRNNFWSKTVFTAQSNIFVQSKAGFERFEWVYWPYWKEITFGQKPFSQLKSNIFVPIKAEFERFKWVLKIAQMLKSLEPNTYQISKDSEKRIPYRRKLFKTLKSNIVVPNKPEF